MNTNQEKKKKELMEETVMIFDQLMEWEDKASAPSLTEIENKVIELGKRMEEKMMKAVIDQGEKRQTHEKQVCPICGGELGNKGSKEKRIETQSGSLKLKRKYYYCPNCRKGFFPPG